MKILAVDTSAICASVAVTQDGKILSESSINTGLTHSRTLMPMIDSALKNGEISLDSIDVFACSVGPGSFTGIRIGVAAIKGLCDALSKKCVPVSTLEALAYNLVGRQCTAVSVMDARCNQVYAAFFDVENGFITRIHEDYAVLISELATEIAKIDKTVILAGDGAELCYNALKDSVKNIKLSSEFRRFQRAYGAALAALEQNNFIQSSLLAPVYLRMPQAERELKLKKENK